MVIQTPIVQIGCSDHGDLTVADTLLGMAESRRILINPNTLAYKTGIIGAGHCIDCFLVRNSRRNEFYIHAVFRRKDQRIDQFRINDQIRGHDVDIFPGLTEDIQVNITRSKKWSELLCRTAALLISNLMRT